MKHYEYIGAQLGAKEGDAQRFAFWKQATKKRNGAQILRQALDAIRLAPPQESAVLQEVQALRAEVQRLTALIQSSGLHIEPVTQYAQDEPGLDALDGLLA